MTIRKLLFLLTSVLSTTSSAQPTWDWARNATGPEHQLAQCIAHDVVGNAYVCGNFHDSATFGSVNLYGDGYWSAFIAKYDPYGNLVWVQSPSGSGNLSEEAHGITVAADGSIYVTGSFSDPFITFGTFTLSGTNSEIYLVKMDAYGTVLWARSAGGTGTESAGTVNTDANGDVYITGYYESAVCTFGSQSISPVNTTSPDIFLAKYDSNGNALWAKTAGGALWDSGASLDFDATGAVYLTGSFQGTAMTAGALNLTGTNGTYDVFVIKYSSAGNEIWGKSFGGTGIDLGVSLKINSVNQIVMTGHIGNAAITFDSFTLLPAGGRTYLVTLDSTGNTIWAINEGGPTQLSAFVYAHTLDLDGNDDIYIAGDITGQVDFSGDTLYNLDMSGQTSDIFIAKYNSSGTLIWIMDEGSIDTDACLALAVKDADNFTIAGVYLSPAISFDSDTLLHTGQEDFYIAQAGSGLTNLHAPEVSGPVEVFPNPASGVLNIIVDENIPPGNLHVVLFDVSGRVVLSEKIYQGKTTVSCNALAEGVYIYQVTNGNKVFGTGKLVLNE